jgi:hypothetical protein
MQRRELVERLDMLKHKRILLWSMLDRWKFSRLRPPGKRDSLAPELVANVDWGDAIVRHYIDGMWRETNSIASFENGEPPESSRDAMARLIESTAEKTPLQTTTIGELTTWVSSTKEHANVLCYISRSFRDLVEECLECNMSRVPPGVSYDATEEAIADFSYFASLLHSQIDAVLDKEVSPVVAEAGVVKLPGNQNCRSVP